MAEGVTCSSRAARKKLAWRAAASKERSELSGGSRRIVMAGRLKQIHLCAEKGSFVAGAVCE
jgi:hypothetical protein